MELLRKLEILADAAKYDASCASSRHRQAQPRWAKTGGVGSTEGVGICHAYAPDGRCISLPENPADQRLHLRLPLLHQPPLLQRAARPLYRGGGGHTHPGFLPAQLHRGSVPQLRHHTQPRLHHGAGGRRRPAPCARRTVLGATSTSRPYRTPTRCFWPTPAATPTGSASMSSSRAKPPCTRWRRKKACPAYASPWAACACGSTRHARRKTRAAASHPPARARRSSSAPDASSDRAIMDMSTNLYGAYGLRRVYYSRFQPDPRRLLPPAATPGPPATRTPAVSGRLAPPLLRFCRRRTRHPTPPATCPWRSTRNSRGRWQHRRPVPPWTSTAPTATCSCASQAWGVKVRRPRHRRPPPPPPAHGRPWPPAPLVAETRTLHCGGGSSPLGQRWIGRSLSPRQNSWS